MGIRSMVGSRLESAIGRARTDTIRKTERSVRNGLATKLEIRPPRRVPPKSSTRPPTNGRPDVRRRWLPADPSAAFPQPKLSRHKLLATLHEKTQPRTYLEVGIRNGASLALSRTRSVGVDPAFKVDRPIHCDVQLIKATSDDFFARENPLSHFDGVPVDLAFIDGMHLSEYVLRDFINTEPLLADAGVIVFDDMLPRNPLEAARDRKTVGWTGDVYKAVQILRRRRPDLVVLLVNTSPTGTAIVVNVDQGSTVLKDAYEEDLEYLLRPDPQTPPLEYMDRSIAVDAEVLLASPVWEQLATYRTSGEAKDLSELWDQLRALDHG